MGRLNLNALLSRAGVFPRRHARAEIQFADRSALAQVFADSGLTAMLPNPMIGDKDGAFGLCYLSSSPKIGQ